MLSWWQVDVCMADGGLARYGFWTPQSEGEAVGVWMVCISDLMHVMMWSRVMAPGAERVFLFSPESLNEGHPDIPRPGL